MASYRLNIATATHKGDREYQQDRVEVLRHPYDNQCLMVVLADGMGGRSGGAKASEQVISSAREMMHQFTVGKDDPAALMRQLVSDAHSIIRMIKVSSEHEPHTTIAAHLRLPSGASHWIHSGDSRIYHFHSGRLMARTRDHSFVQTLIDQGEITEQEAIGHPRSNLLTGCLGMDVLPPIAQYRIDKLELGDVILSCTDGLWAYFNETELAKIVDSLTAAEACRLLVEQARERAEGAGDNIAVAILKASKLPSSHAPQPHLLQLDW